jgi:hypothetical protein
MSMFSSIAGMMPTLFSVVYLDELWVELVQELWEDRIHYFSGHDSYYF